MTQVAIFGPGSLYLTRTDVANATPVNVGYAQEFSIDETAEEKPLYGQDKYPLMIATGTVKATGKMKSAMISGIALNNGFWGQTFVSGQVQMVQQEPQTTAGNFTLVNGNLTYDYDLGVVYAASGLPLTKLPNGTSSATLTVGQYALGNATTGNYTYSSADGNGTPMLITYAKTVTGSGQKMILSNTLIGTNTSFQLDYATSVNVYGVAKPCYIRLYNCIASKLARSFKLTDFMNPELDFTFSQVGNGSIYMMSLPEIS